jgi:uncharacterized membrane protein
MTVADVTTLITSTAGDLGGGVLGILGIVLGIAVAYFLFKFGWRKLKGSIR